MASATSGAYSDGSAQPPQDLTSSTFKSINAPQQTLMQSKPTMQKLATTHSLLQQTLAPPQHLPSHNAAQRANAPDTTPSTAES